MKKLILYVGLAVVSVLASFGGAKAQDPITLVIKQGITKVIKAVDLRIQRLQNETIWLQNAQKVVENTLSKVKLGEIAGWVERQRTLYKDYYDELWKVKSIITYYHRIKEVTEMQIRLVEEYKKAWALFRQDEHFAPEEIAYMGRVYGGILDQSVKNLDQLFLVINSFSTQMSDAKRLQIVNGVAETMEATFSDLKAFSQQGMLLSLERAKAAKNVDAVKRLYGIK